MAERATNADGRTYDIDKDDIFGRNRGGLKPLSVRSSAFSSFSNVLPPASAPGMPQSDLYRSLNMDRGNEGQFRHGQSASSGTKAQGSSPKGRHKDGETASNDPIECALLGVNYGGRDFYASSTEASETNKSNNKNEVDKYGDSNVANRGEWWQGSLYY